jgi:Cu(I)/Ag(I) efflux system membrane fusion protein
VPAEFQLQLAGVWNSYLVVQKSLAGDQFTQAVTAVAQLDSAVKSTDMKLLTENSTHMAWMKELANLKKIIELLKPSKDLTAMRAAFQSLSGEMFVLKRSFGFGPKATVYQLHCPMAFGNKGANWLQGDKKVKNPYFGSTMLGCADRVELISEPIGGSRVEGRGSREKEE